ncbi:MAG: peptide ABC transporter substrate-binding protein [Firmicutes bacterium]|nr:peptide ABC transporter substrate-binding protein [Bacillota bacterium]
MTKRTIALVLAALMVFGLVAAGCSKPAATGPSANGKPQILKWNLGDEPPSMDSVLSTDQVSFWLLNATQEGLVRQIEGQLPTKGSGLAKDWTISPDGTVYTFTLRDAKWSDGQPITAKDFVFAWKRAMNPKTAAEYSYQFAYIKGFDELSKIDVKAAGADQKIKEALDKVGVVAKDDKTLEVTLNTATPYFLSLMSFPTFLPERQDIVEKYGEKYAAEASNMVFSGPFTITEWTHETKMVLTKNQNYWDKDNVKLDGMETVMIKDINTPVNMYEAGDLDMINVPPEFLAQYKAKGNVVTRAQSTAWYIEFNTKDSIMKNTNIRKAFSLALDRQEFVDKVLANGSVVATAYTPPTIAGNKGSFHGLVGDVLNPKADPAAAKAALDAGLKELGLSKMPKISFLSGDSDRAKKWAVAFQEMWKQNLGVEVNVETVSFKVRLDRMTKGQYQMVIAGWGADYNDPMTFIDLWHSMPADNPGNNSAFYNNPAYDKLVDDAKSTGDQAKRMDDMKQAEQILLNELPVAPVFYPAWNYIEKPYVKGIQHFAVGSDYEFKFASMDPH